MLGLTLEQYRKAFKDELGCDGVCEECDGSICEEAWLLDELEPCLWRDIEKFEKAMIRKYKGSLRKFQVVEIDYEIRGRCEE